MDPHECVSAWYIAILTDSCNGIMRRLGMLQEKHTDFGPKT